MAEPRSFKRNLAMEAVFVTEAAARAANSWMGLGDEKSADQAAVYAMNEAFKELPVDGTIRIGESNANGSSKLVVGEKVGTGNGSTVDVALMPVEGFGDRPHQGSAAALDSLP